MTQGVDDTNEPTLRMDLDEAARAKRVDPVRSLKDLDRFALDAWDSDEDLDAFLADVRANRNADLA